MYQSAVTSKSNVVLLLYKVIRTRSITKDSIQQRYNYCQTFKILQMLWSESVPWEHCPIVEFFNSPIHQLTNSRIYEFIINSWIHQFTNSPIHQFSNTPNSFVVWTNSLSNSNAVQTKTIYVTNVNSIKLISISIFN